MPRDDDAILIRKWAAAGDVATPESQGLDRAVGWPASYSPPGDNAPQREVFNQFWREVTAMLAEINETGCGLEWDARIDYRQHARVMGSDGEIYRAVVANGPTEGNATNPVGRTTDAVWTEPSSAIPVGVIWDFAGGTVPQGWLACNGAAVSRATYLRLFTVVGSTWGAGDGTTTFNVPDLRRRVTIGAGGAKPAGSGGPATVLGNVGGAETHTLTEAEMPEHDHTIHVIASTGGGSGGSELVNPDQSSTSHKSGETGGGGAHNNMPPSAVVTKIIKS